jgi:exodeoxyribonuclease-3
VNGCESFWAFSKQRKVTSFLLIRNLKTKAISLSQTNSSNQKNMNELIFKDEIELLTLTCFKGWSGVTTYCKKGLTQDAKNSFGIKKFDDEGRIVMTDHGTFVLFNVYFPNAGKVRISPPS